MSTDELRAAVKNLRLALGKTQTEFGAMIGKSLPTIQRYESLVPPKGRILLKLEALAREKKFDEYAQTFRAAIRTDLGLDMPDMAANPVEINFPTVVGPHIAEPKSQEHRKMHDTLQALLCQAEWPGNVGDEARKELKLINRALRRVRIQLEDAFPGAYVTADRVRAVVQFVREGMSPESIAKKLELSNQQVESLLSLYREER